MVTATTCLDIAIDHRIRDLFSPITMPVGSSIPDTRHEPNAFRGVINFVHDIRRLDAKEIDVTERLAGPYGITRGITVLLKQPRDEHPFHRGMAATVRECRTLQALHDMFQAATLCTVGISDINVVDALPFVRPSDEKPGSGAEEPLITDETKRVLRSKVRPFLESNAPSVIMCASQECIASDPLTDLTSRGVGKTFLSEPDIDMGGQTCCRVNSFHPSSALNYRKLEPQLRQLLLLEAVQTCKQVKRTWKTDKWMNELRLSCENIYSGNYVISLLFTVDQKLSFSKLRRPNLREVSNRTFNM
jgi:hypothetical protein